MAGLIPPEPRLYELLATLPPSPPKPPSHWRQKAADDQDFLDRIKAVAYEDQERSRVAALRADLQVVLGPRLDQEFADQLAAFGLTESKTKEYAERTARFRRWCAEGGLPYLPTAPEVVAQFNLEDCCLGDGPPDAERARENCSAISLRHRLAGFADPTDTPISLATVKYIEGDPVEPPAGDPPPDQQPTEH
jgi:hypothetical protein